MKINLRFGSKISCSCIAIFFLISIAPDKEIMPLAPVPILSGAMPENKENADKGGPVKFSLEPAYPNPFNGYVVIPFTILENGEYRLEIRNVLGEKIKELAYKSYSPGKYSVSWNGLDEDNNSVPSGIYFARLSANEQLAKIQKLVYLK